MSASKRIWECAVYRYRNEWGNRIIQSWQIALLFLCSRSGIGRHEYQFMVAAAEGAIEDVTITESRNRMESNWK